MKRLLKAHGWTGTLGIVAVTCLAYLYAAVTPRTAQTKEMRRHLRQLWRR